MPLSFYAFNRGDSVYIAEYNKRIYFNSDTIFHDYANKGFLDVVNDLYEYYEDVFAYLSSEKKMQEIEKMRNIANEYKNKQLLNEAKLLEVLCLPEIGDEQIFFKAESLQEIADKSAKNKDYLMQMRSMEYILDLYWRTARYSRAFKQIYSIEKQLQNITDEQYPFKEAIYFRIGEAYFFFNDFDKAIPYLRRAMVPSKFYIDRSNLKAINAIGNCHSIQGRIDSADYYYRMAYNSYDNVKSRRIYDAIALTNLGYNLIQRKKYDEAIPYFRAGFTYMLDQNDYKSASEVTVGLAQCYYEKGDMRKTGQLIDSSFLYIRKSGNVNLYKSLYPLVCEYYIKTGNKSMAHAYLDSAITFNEKYLNKYNSMHILRAEQELFDTETQAKNEELRYQQKMYSDRFFYSILTIVFAFIGLSVFFVLYHRNKKAYRALVQKNQDWAATNTVFETPLLETPQEGNNIDEPDKPDQEDLELMKQVHDLMKNQKVFKELDMTLETLSKQINANRNYLSKAINKTTGKNFNTFINEYRIKEAIKIMSDEKSDLISIDAIALEVGFNNRISFYQSFKKITGLTPSDFRNNKSKPTPDLV